ncbi:hypothetical protein ACLB1T_02055 [Escherichia coli]
MPVTANGTHGQRQEDVHRQTYNQNFRDAGVSVYLKIPRHTYWDREEQTNYNIMLSHLFQYGQYS